MAAVAVFVEFQPIWIVATILFCGVITLFALSAGEVNYLTDIFLSHAFPLAFKGDL